MPLDSDSEISLRRVLLKPQSVGLVMGILAVMMPFLIQVSGAGSNTDITIAATTWMFQKSSYYNGFRLFQPAEWLLSMPYTFPRLIFAYQMNRYYHEICSRSSTVLVGVIAEMPVSILAAIFLLANVSSSYTLMLPIIIPLPLLLISGLFLIWLQPKFISVMLWDNK